MFLRIFMSNSASLWVIVLLDISQAFIYKQCIQIKVFIVKTLFTASACRFYPLQVLQTFFEVTLKTFRTRLENVDLSLPHKTVNLIKKFLLLQNTTQLFVSINIKLKTRNGGYVPQHYKYRVNLGKAMAFLSVLWIYSLVNFLTSW